MMDSSSTKTSVKWLEVPIQKFNVAVPHFVDLVKVHNNNIIKLKRINQWEEMKRELNSASRIINQLTTLLSELDNVRNQVADEDLFKFDKLIHTPKQSAMNVIQSHKDIIAQSHPDQHITDQNPLKSSATKHLVNKEVQDQQLQVVADLSEDIEKQEQYAVSMERLKNDVEDINSLFQDLSQLVHDQGENVEKIDEHVEKTHQNVIVGEKMLCQAAKYKNGMYPLLGALIGSVVGGPIGLLAGFKLGGLTAAVGCGFLGFTGGKILKNQNEVSISEAECHREQLSN